MRVIPKEQFPLWFLNEWKSLKKKKVFKVEKENMNVTKTCDPQMCCEDYQQYYITPVGNANNEKY